MREHLEEDGQALVGAEDEVQRHRLEDATGPARLVFRSLDVIRHLQWPKEFRLLLVMEALVEWSVFLVTV